MCSSENCSTVQQLREGNSLEMTKYKKHRVEVVKIKAERLHQGGWHVWFRVKDDSKIKDNGTGYHEMDIAGHASKYFLVALWNTWNAL